MKSVENGEDRRYLPGEVEVGLETHGEDLVIEHADSVKSVVSRRDIWEHVIRQVDYYLELAHYHPHKREEITNTMGSVAHNEIIHDAEDVAHEKGVATLRNRTQKELDDPSKQFSDNPDECDFCVAHMNHWERRTLHEYELCEDCRSRYSELFRLYTPDE